MDAEGKDDETAVALAADDVGAGDVETGDVATGDVTEAEVATDDLSSRGVDSGVGGSVAMTTGCLSEDAPDPAVSPAM